MCSDSYNIVLRKYKSSKYSVSLVKRKKAIAPMYEARNEQLPSAVVLLHLVNVNNRRWLGDKTFNMTHKCLWRVLNILNVAKNGFEFRKRNASIKRNDTWVFTQYGCMAALPIWTFTIYRLEIKMLRIMYINLVYFSQK